MGMATVDAGTSSPSKRIQKRVARALKQKEAKIRHAKVEYDALFMRQVKFDKTDPPTREELFQALPRRRRLIFPTDDNATSPIFHNPTFHSSVWQAFSRLFMWIQLVGYILGGNFWDRITGRDTVERRATRLRVGLEHIGGTFVKFGQQIAMRIDLVPWEYCVELSKMLDKMIPFTVEEAIAAIEKSTGKPWQDTFAVFDPEPIGSASIACVYQAVLRDGTKVAVKVRRPGIGEMFMADLRVLDWIFNLIEFLTIVRPGFTRNLRVEFRETLLEELDFTREGRFQDIFRRTSKKSGLDYFTAPKVYTEFSSENVLVQEFVAGMWLWEVMTAVEHQDEKGLAMMTQLNIDPKLVAKRILWSAFWSMDENIFFHADPHPANILVRPNSDLTYIDFGSCGSFNNDQRVALEQVVLAVQKRDAEGMARATLKLLEPFPPVDVPALLREAEAEFTQVLYIFETKAEYTEWWERTSARQWLAFVRLARGHNIPMNLHTLRMIRATLLYDTLVLRLDHTSDRYAEYGDFMEHRGKLARKRWFKERRKESGDMIFLRMNNVLEAGENFVSRAQHQLSNPTLRFNLVVDKWIFTVAVLSRMLWRILLLTMLATLVVSLSRIAGNQTVFSLETLTPVFRNPFYQLITLAILILNIRHILFRLTDRER